MHEYVLPVLERAGDFPMVGTVAWCALADDDPRKIAAVFDAAQHWALRIEASQIALADASKEIAAAADWAGIARRITQAEGVRIRRVA
ncbi:hypothetical protein AWB98_06675 [Mycolicibacterium conceptionense]|uniref:PhiRv1 phage protein n=1 Tax=Mycolicibacterium conceptionense TaxID=451644 RepID=A0ABX3VF02_9MYCO|nr:hypothetical protein AWB98_06675 [Mycolicibacterium conceptionense]